MCSSAVGVYFNVNHDINTLTSLCDRPGISVNRLEMISKPGSNTPERSSYNSTILNPENERSFTAFYIHSYAGRQDLGIEQRKFIGKPNYASRPDALPGNSEEGAMEP
jgi:putative alpha-1,2-mannosidase